MGWKGSTLKLGLIYGDSEVVGMAESTTIVIRIKDDANEQSKLYQKIMQINKVERNTTKYEKGNPRL